MYCSTVQQLVPLLPSLPPLNKFLVHFLFHLCISFFLLFCCSPILDSLDTAVVFLLLLILHLLFPCLGCFLHIILLFPLRIGRLTSSWPECLLWSVPILPVDSQPSRYRGGFSGTGYWHRRECCCFDHDDRIVDWPNLSECPRVVRSVCQSQQSCRHADLVAPTEKVSSWQLQDLILSISVSFFLRLVWRKRVQISPPEEAEIAHCQ